MSTSYYAIFSRTGRNMPRLGCVCWQASVSAGRPLCLLTGLCVCWQDSVSAGRPLCLLAGLCVCWQASVSDKIHQLLRGEKIFD